MTKSIAETEASSNESPCRLCWCPSGSQMGTTQEGPSRTSLRSPEEETAGGEGGESARGSGRNETEQQRSSCSSSMDPPPEGKPTFPTSTDSPVGGGGSRNRKLGTRSTGGPCVRASEGSLLFCRPHPHHCNSARLIEVSPVALPVLLRPTSACAPHLLRVGGGVPGWFGPHAGQLGDLLVGRPRMHLQSPARGVDPAVARSGYGLCGGARCRSPGCWSGR